MTSFTDVSYNARIETQTQLFVDDYRIAAMTGVSRQVHAATDHGAFLKPDKPWEGNIAMIYGSAIYDDVDGSYHLWYQTYNRNRKPKFLLCYATSDDGRTWNKPDLGLYSHEGSTANNIIGDMACATVLLDRRDPDSTRRYKMFSVRYESGYWVWFSPDGIHWSPSAANPVLPDGDVANVNYDPTHQRFIAVTKHPQPAAERVAFVSYSDDFEQWTEPEVTLRADERDHAAAKSRDALNAQIYGMAVIPYAGLYIGLPSIYEYSGAGEPNTGGEGIIDTQIGFSRDLIHWTRDDRRAVIANGSLGTPGAGMIFAANDAIVRDDKIDLYYSRFDGSHGSRTRGASIGLASWRLDGFASLSRNADEAGSATTRPLIFSGASLRLNADFSCESRGVLVEILDLHGDPIPGFAVGDAMPVIGDHLDAKAKWSHGADVSALAGSSIRLRFHLEGMGDLYSFRFSE